MKSPFCRISIILTAIIICCFTGISFPQVQDNPPEITAPVIPTDATMYKYYPSRTISKSKTPYYIPVSDKPFTAIDKTTTLEHGNDVSFMQYLKNTETIAFLVIQNDTLRYEKYFSSAGINYDSASVFTSFSVAKSFVSVLAGTALDEKLIKNIEDPVTAYIAGLPVNKGFEKIKVKHLLQMTSGIKFNEEKGLSSDLSNLYQVTDIRDYLKHIEIMNMPGTQFSYKSIDTQLLALLLTKATGTTLTQYLQEKIWEPLGMEYNASWNIDKPGGVERAYSCINARARDFAKFGLLMLNKGKWKGKQIIPEAWAKACMTADIIEGGSPFYKYQWWLIGGLLGDSQTDFAAIGIRGQFIYVNPEKKTVIVKFSNKDTDYKSDYIALRSLMNWL